jgi:recombination protein RecT
MAETAIQQQPKKSAALTLVDLITSRRDAFAQVAPKHFSVERLVKLAHASLSRTPKLAQCTGESLLVQLMRCAELGLEPNSPLGGMHLVPFDNRKTGKTECQGIIDYRALVALARRSDQISAIAARVVYSRDTFECREDETGVHFTFVQAEGDRGDMVKVFAYARLKSGEVQFDQMSRADVDRIKARSKASSSGPWVTDYDAMAAKTVLRRLCKLLPLTTEAAAVIAEEEAAEAEVAVELVPPATQRQAKSLKEKLQAKVSQPAAVAAASFQEAEDIAARAFPIEDYQDQDQTEEPTP